MAVIRFPDFIRVSELAFGKTCMIATFPPCAVLSDDFTQELFRTADGIINSHCQAVSHCMPSNSNARFFEIGCQASFEHICLRAARRMPR